MANFYGATLLIGGGAGALDNLVDVNGDPIGGDGLDDGDGAVVITSSGSYVYFLDATSGLSESSPDVIAPDVTPGTKRWILQGVVGDHMVRGDIGHDVRAYGAVGDGVADDTAAVASAASAADGSILYVPAGTYLISSTITLPRIHMIGGFANSIFKSAITDGSAMFVIDASRTSIEGIVFDGDDKNCIGLTDTGAILFPYYLCVRRCNFGDFGSYAISLTTTYSWGAKVVETVFNGGSEHQFYANPAGQQVEVHKCWFYDIAVDKYGIYFVSAKDVLVSQTAFTSYRVGGVGESGNGMLVSGYNVALRGCNFEDLEDSVGTPTGIGLTIGDATAYWRHILLEHITFEDLATAIRIATSSINSSADNIISIVQSRFANVTTMLDCTDRSKNNSRIICDEHAALAPATNDSNYLYEPYQSNRKNRYSVVIADQTVIAAQTCIRISRAGTDVGAYAAGIFVKRCWANTVANSANPVGFSIDAPSGFGKPFTICTYGPVDTGQDQSGWTIGNSAYVQDDGTIGDSPGTETVEIGVILDQADPGHIFFKV